jgi:molecular chaperone DnaK (HSP70)
MSPPRYIIGIDLGTTNSAVAYVDTTKPERRVEPFPVLQLVSEGHFATRPNLPSSLYIAGEHDVPPGSLALPWDAGRSYAVGELARIQGARVAGRLVTSAKSWLCHGGVDRTAAILPWGSQAEVKRLSPVEVSARYLQHVREAWEHAFPDAPLSSQDVVLTVPASFDEVARELTVDAAARAGLPRVVLLEEPQAAFYAWIHQNEDSWAERLEGIRLVVVIDIGGGTTDFSLVAIRHQDGRIGLDRLAVGDHLLLGGDNIDVALARLLEPRLGTRLDSQRWFSLANLCRAAKEELLGPNPPAETTIRLIGRGRAVVGGVLTATLTRDEVERLVLDGFFPLTPPDALPRRSPRVGLQEFGLPFAEEPEVSRQLAAFLRAHRHDDDTSPEGTPEWPDAVLFNGGALKPPLVRDRLTELLSRWRGGQGPVVLASADLDLAVARGAAYYGLVRRGLGVRIGGGSARSYYLGLGQREQENQGELRVLCVVQRGMYEGESIEISQPEFAVTANRPVSFPLYASSTRLGDRAGSLICAERETLTELPPIRTVLRFGKKLGETSLPVHVQAQLTEVGTLEVWCRSLKTDHRWRLEFAVRDHPASEGDGDQGARAEVELEVAPERIEEATAALRATFPPDPSSTAGDPVGLTRDLEEKLGAGKDAWPLAAIRRLWDVLWEGRAARGRGPEYEGRWLNLSGFLLRPGFGHDLDDWRIQQLWKLISTGPAFPRAIQCRVEWWNMWKRIAGGLARAQQLELYNQVAPHLLPRLAGRAKGKRQFAGPQELREYWQLVASCERLPAEMKAELGGMLLAAVLKAKATDAEIWALGRLGARAPFAGPLNCVVDRRTVEEWLEQLLQRDWPRAESTSFAVVQLARRVGDRERDLDQALRARLAERLRRMPAGERAARLVTEVVPLGKQERARILDESLPVGLQLRNDER